MSAVTNGAIVYRNFLGGGPLEHLLNVSGCSPPTMLKIESAVNLTTMSLTFLAQALVIYCFARSAQRKS